MNSSFSHMQQAILAMAHIGTAIGSVNHCLQTSSIYLSSGRSCTPLLLHAKYGASTGQAKGFCFTVTMNDAVVNIWLSGRSYCPDLIDLVRDLFFIAANNNFNVMIRHIPGINNSIADALYHLQLSRFCALAPQADPHLSPTPAELMPALQPA